MNNNSKKQGKGGKQPSKKNKNRGGSVNSVMQTSGTPLSKGYSLGRLAGRQPLIAPRANAKLSMAMIGFMAVANSSAAYLISIPGNGLFQPLNQSAGTNTQPNYAMAPLTGSTSFATATPPGFSLYGAFYKQYKVRSSVIKVTVEPLTIGDTCAVSIWPATNETSSIVGYVGTIAATTPTGDKCAQFSYGETSICSAASNPNGRDGNTIVLQMSTARINGLTQGQFENDVVNGVQIFANPDRTVGNQDVDLPWDWWIGISECTNNNFSSQLIIKAELEWDVEFFDAVTVST